MYAKEEEEGDLSVIRFLKIYAETVCTVGNRDTMRTYLGFLGSVLYFYA
jgi:hypothetical protein